MTCSLYQLIPLDYVLYINIYYNVLYIIYTVYIYILYTVYIRHMPGLWAAGQQHLNVKFNRGANFASSFSRLNVQFHGGAKFDFSSSFQLNVDGNQPHCNAWAGKAQALRAYTYVYIFVELD